MENKVGCVMGGRCWYTAEIFQDKADQFSWQTDPRFLLIVATVSECGVHRDLFIESYIVEQVRSSKGEIRESIVHSV